MAWLTLLSFYCAIGAYIIAAVATLVYVRNGNDDLLGRAKQLAGAGNVLLLVVFLSRGIQFNRIPFTGLGDSLNLFLIMCTGIILILQREQALRPLMAYYMPALTVLAMISGMVSPSSLTEEPELLNSLFSFVHVVLIFLAFALFFIASITSMAYVTKAQSLKRISSGTLANRLPSLERLDKVLFKLIGYGYPAFVITLALGFFLMFEQRADLGEYWYFHKRIVLALFMVFFYAGSFHVRRRGLLRGPKLAYLVFFVSTALFIIYILIELMGTGGYTNGGTP